MQKEKKEMTESERIETELMAISVLQQYGASVKIPLKDWEIQRLRVQKKWYYKIYPKRHKVVLPPNLQLTSVEIPDPYNPEQTKVIMNADVRIKPLYLTTIDAVRSKRLQLELADPLTKKYVYGDIDKDGENVDHDYMLRYTKEMAEIVAIATINEGDLEKFDKEIKAWQSFYLDHLVNSRLIKLVQIIKLMEDSRAFLDSIRLIWGMETTAPHEAIRIEVSRD